jgi:hypothetical protein
MMKIVSSNYQNVYIGLLIILLLIGCKYEPTDAILQNPISTDSACFNTQILPLFVSNCAMSGCHSTSTKAAGYQFTNFTGIKTGINNGEIMKAINEPDPVDRMPPAGPLPASQIQLIEKWISQGATEKICSNNCDTFQVKYTTHIASIISGNCLGCHKGNATSGGGINLENYASVQSQTMTGKMICSVKQLSGCSPMPKNGANLGVCDIRKFELWKAAGCPQ